MVSTEFTDGMRRQRSTQELDGSGAQVMCMCDLAWGGGFVVLAS